MLQEVAELGKNPDKDPFCQTHWHLLVGLQVLGLTRIPSIAVVGPTVRPWEWFAG